MKSVIRKVVVTLLAIASPMAVDAQTEKGGVETYVDIDLVSHYIWRGLDVGAVSLQPELSFSWKGLKLRFEGNAGLENQDPKEIDLTLGYETYGFNIGVTDYWTTGVDENNRYFVYDKKGPHQLEANIGYSCKYGSLQAYTMFWGNDFKISGNQAYSTYIELSVPFKLGDVECMATVGGTPFESAGTKTEITTQNSLGTFVETKRDYFYADGPACVSAVLRATKTLELGKVHLPVFVEMNTNPYLQKATVICGLTLVPF